MTICYFSAQYLPTVGGVERYTWNLARCTVAAGHRAIVVTSALPNLPEREIDGDGIEIYRLPVWPVMSGRFPIIKPGARFDALTAQIWAQKLDFCVVQTRMYTQSVWAARAAKRRGVNVTCETAPHYIAFSEEDVTDDGKFKMNPPIRSERDKAAILEAVKDGTIDMIATDHAPHSAEEKSKGFEDSLNGIIGLETAFAVMNTLLCETGEIPFEKLVQLMSTNPASRFNLDGGQLAEGGSADIVIIDKNAEWVIDKEKFKSMGRSCPFDGMKVKGQVAATICGGDIVYER